MNRLNSVAHSIAQHAVSGLCNIHPWLGRHFKEIGKQHASVDLLEGLLQNHCGDVPKEIGLASGALKEKFFDILGAEGFNRSDLSEAIITFQFSRWHWPSGCNVKLVTSTGEGFNAAVDEMGNPAQVIHHSND